MSERDDEEENEEEQKLVNVPCYVFKVISKRW